VCTDLRKRYEEIASSVPTRPKHAGRTGNPLVTISRLLKQLWERLGVLIDVSEERGCSRRSLWTAVSKESSIVQQANEQWEGCISRNLPISDSCQPSDQFRRRTRIRIDERSVCPIDEIRGFMMINQQYRLRTNWRNPIR
jgi:hypothetical protein